LTRPQKPAHVRFAAKTTGVLCCREMTQCAIKGSESLSFDHLIGERQQIWRHVDSKDLRALKIDHQFEPGWLFDRKLCRFGALEDFVHEDSSAAIHLGFAGEIGHQATIVGEVAKRAYARYSISECQLGDPFGRQTGLNDDSINPCCLDRCKSEVEFL